MDNENKDVIRDRIAKQLSKWKTAAEGLMTKIERAEETARVKLREQLDGLQDKRVKAEKMLDELSATSQEAWGSVRAGIEQGWADLSRTAKTTVRKVRETMAHPDREAEIRQIAYFLWLDEGCPNGRHLDHWYQAESIWRERQAAGQRAESRPPKARRKQTTTAASPNTKTRSVKTKSPGARESSARDLEKR
ncbi:MAG: DUF2934 domain-containing protein [Chloroflexota bacterium]